MSLQFAATLPAEERELGDFLCGTFRASPQAASFRRETLHWKYFAEHPEYRGPRSYVVRGERGIVAHAGIWPIDLLRNSSRARAIHLIDWAAAPEAPGTGLLLLRKLAEKADLLLTIGGSSDTQAILPKIGSKHLGDLKMYARVVRPTLQLRTTPRAGWKAALKFLRNAAIHPGRLPSLPKNWEALPIADFDASMASILDADGNSGVFRARRTVAGLNHMLECPAAIFSAFHVLRSGKPRGYLVLSRAGHQSRIADLRVQGDDADWECAASLATRTAAASPEVCEVVAGFSNGRIQQALEQCGFRLRRADPIFGYDPRRLPDSAELDLNLLDGDACFMHDPQNPYLS